MRVFWSYNDGSLWPPSTIEAEMTPAEIAERYRTYELTQPSGAPLQQGEPLVGLYFEDIAQGERSLAEVLRRKGCLRDPA